MLPQISATGLLGLQHLFVPAHGALRLTAACQYVGLEVAVSFQQFDTLFNQPRLLKCAAL